MKKLQLIILCLLYSIGAIGQQTMPVDHEVMQLKLPKATQKLNEQQLMGLSHNGFSEKTISYFHDHIYKKDGLLIYYLNSSVSPKLKKSMENNQKMMVSLTNQESGSIVDNSKIITINNIRFSIIEYHNKDNWYLWFTSDYDKDLKFINGFIEYKKPDEAKAKQYLQDLLKDMHFKNQQ
jgi:hypothetical protein